MQGGGKANCWGGQFGEPMASAGTRGRCASGIPRGGFVTKDLGSRRASTCRLRQILARSVDWKTDSADDAGARALAAPGPGCRRPRRRVSLIGVNTCDDAGTCSMPSERRP